VSEEMSGGELVMVQKSCVKVVTRLVEHQVVAKVKDLRRCPLKTVIHVKQKRTAYILYDYIHQLTGQGFAMALWGGAIMARISCSLSRSLEYSHGPIV